MRALLVVLGVLAPGCLAPAIDAPVEEAGALGSGTLVAFEKVHTPEEIAGLVESYSDLGLDVAVLGSSGEGRPLHLVTAGSGPFVLWAVGRHHGNEPTGAEAILLVLRVLADADATLAPDAPPILRDLLEYRETILSRVTLVTVPVVNPDGAAAFTRGNARTPDPNRDYAAFATIESQLVRDAFWAARPDLCLDLHNEGPSERFDWDAFVPDGLPESDVQRALVAQAWRTVHEVDASGGFGGGPNENYQLDPLPVVNPTAFHPGTHDMFCALRGAPGWTPEGAIPEGENGATDAAFAWSTRLHAVTLASALLEAAGVYEGLAAPVVAKATGTLDPVGALATVVELEARAAGRMWLQVVWRPAADPVLSHVPVGVEFRTPTGEIVSAGAPAPGAYTATAVLEDAPAGAYQALLQGPPGTAYEFRLRVAPPQEPPLLVTRAADGLVVESRSWRPLEVRLSDSRSALRVVEPAAAFTIEGTSPVALRVVVGWELTVAPGERRVLLLPADEEAGPFRWTVSDGASIAAGVEGARSTR